MPDSVVGKSPGVNPSLPPLYAVVIVTLVVFLGIAQLQPPKVISVDAPATEFSAARARESLNALARNPHPTGSAENARVRAYLANQLQTLGFEPQVQTATGTHYEQRWRGGIASVATVNNLMARLPGSGSDHRHALMLAAHYDSVRNGPGASDDGSGTVTLLETARALASGPRLRNDVIFLFTDGEELGLLGAKAFVDEHPWSKDVAVVLNFEARGACGPSFMFETSPDNGWVIRQLALAAPTPVTSSVMYDFYKRLPNDTDFTVFKRAGMSGLNFAYIGCWTRYHTLRDDVANLDARSLQHDGSYALALARHFGNLDLSRTANPDRVYFSVFHWIIHYPKDWAAPIAFLVLAVFAGAVLQGLRRGRLTLGGMGIGFLGWAGGAAAAIGVAEFIWHALRATRLVSLLPYGMAYNGDLYALGLVALTVSELFALYARFLRRANIADLTTGTLGWWVVLTMASAFVMPGGSVLFAWPLLAASLVIAYAFSNGPALSEVKLLLVWTLPALVAALLFAPLVPELLELASTSILPLIIGVVALLVGFLVPLIHILVTHWKRWPAVTAACVALALMVAAMSQSGYDAADPRGDSLFYVLNADTRKAVWASADSSTDAWTSQFLAGRPRKSGLLDFPISSLPTLQADAPAASLPAPEVTAMEDITLGEVRVVRLRVKSPRGASRLFMHLQGANVLEADVSGKSLKNAGSAAGPQGWGMIYTGLPEHGLVVTLQFPVSSNPALRVVDISDTLPQAPGVTFRPRPPDLMPSPLVRFDSCTLVSKTFRLDASMPMEMEH